MPPRMSMQCFKYGFLLLLLSTSLVHESSAQEGKSDGNSEKTDPTSPSPPAGATVTGHNE